MLFTKLLKSVFFFGRKGLIWSLSLDKSNMLSSLQWKRAIRFCKRKRRNKVYVSAENVIPELSSCEHSLLLQFLYSQDLFHDIVVRGGGALDETPARVVEQEGLAHLVPRAVSGESGVLAAAAVEGAFWK